MDIFKENKCRLCKKVFCCIHCRKNHEENTHSINPDCDICFYGRAILRDPSENLLLHIKSKHWPLHCVNCNRVFGCVDELVTHNKCPINTKITVNNFANVPITPNMIIEDSIYDSSLRVFGCVDELVTHNKCPINTKITVNNFANVPITPNMKSEDSIYDSPPFMYPFGKNTNVNITIPTANNVLQLTTSTPMQDDEDKRFLENMSQAITPVDAITKDNERNDNEMNLELPKESMKRKVTFNDTRMNDYSKSYDNNSTTNTKSSLQEKKYAEYESQESFDEYGENQVSASLSNTKWETAISDTPKCSEREHLSALKTNENKENLNFKDSHSLIMNSVKLESSPKKVKNPNSKSSDNEVDGSSIWSFMTNLVKSVMSGVPSKSTQCRKSQTSFNDAEGINL